MNLMQYSSLLKMVVSKENVNKIQDTNLIWLPKWLKNYYARLCADITKMTYFKKAVLGTKP